MFDTAPNEAPADTTSATIRTYLINIPARITRSARRATLRLPANWLWQHAFDQIFATALRPPATT